MLGIHISVHLVMQYYKPEEATICAVLAFYFNHFIQFKILLSLTVLLKLSIDRKNYHKNVHVLLPLKNAHYSSNATLQHFHELSIYHDNYKFEYHAYEGQQCCIVLTVYNVTVVTGPPIITTHPSCRLIIINMMIAMITMINMIKSNQSKLADLRRNEKSCTKQG